MLSLTSRSISAKARANPFRVMRTPSISLIFSLCLKKALASSTLVINGDGDGDGDGGSVSDGDGDGGGDGDIGGDGDGDGDQVMVMVPW